MFVPYNVDVPMSRLPWANWTLIAITSVISLAILFDKWPIPKKPSADTEEIDADEDPQAAFEREVRRVINEIEKSKTEPPPLALRPDHFSVMQLFSYQFVHADALHLIGNMIFLFCFGNAVNAKLGHFPFLVLYLGLGALAGASWLLLGNAVPVVGASGAINGITGIFLVLYPRNEVRVFYLWSLGIGVYEIASGWVISLYLVGDVIGICFDSHGQIGYLGHLVGLFSGVAVAIFLLRLRVIRSTSYEENILQLLGIEEKRRRRSAWERKSRKPRIHPEGFNEI
jgi:membrane associated rhomboid family serine protease